MKAIVLICVVFSIVPSYGRHLLAQPESTLPDELTRLTKDTPIQGFLTTDASKFGISVRARNGIFPDILLSLEVINAGANADVRCTPYNQSANLENYRWSSADVQGIDHVFITTNSPYYNDGVTGEIADFLCSITRVSFASPAYKVEFSLSYTKRQLIKSEQEAIRGIYEKCCSKPDSCLRWKENQHSVELEEKEAKREVTDFDMCHIAPNVCDEDGHLLKLHLDIHGLQCPFPTEAFTNFPRLQKISAMGNQLTGDFYDIAQALKESKHLVEIRLGSNLISGALVRSGEPETANPLCILTRRSLQHLELTSNNVKGPLPDCLLSKNSHLRDLILERNPIGGSIPDVIPKDSALEVIEMQSTMLTGSFPTSFVHSKHLVIVDLSSNSLDGELPNDFGPAPKLKHLFLSRNRFTGKIPDGIAASETLQTVKLDRNAFDSLPKQWITHGPRTPLVNLDISYNQIEEEFPVALSLQTRLSTLFINDNKFRGPLPTLPDMFPNTWVLNMSHNAFVGNLPQEWTTIGMFRGTARPLTYIAPALDLSYNQLSGKVPSFFFNIDNLPKSILVSDGINLEGNDFDCPVSGTSAHIRGFEQCSGEKRKPVFGESVFIVPTTNQDSSAAFGADTAEVENEPEGMLLSEEETEESNEMQSESSDSNLTLWIVLSIVASILLISLALGIAFRYRMVGLARTAMARPKDDPDQSTSTPAPVAPKKDVENERLRVGALSSDAVPL